MHTTGDQQITKSWQQQQLNNSNYSEGIAAADLVLRKSVIKKLRTQRYKNCQHYKPMHYAKCAEKLLLESFNNGSINCSYYLLDEVLQEHKSKFPRCRSYKEIFQAMNSAQSELKKILAEERCNPMCYFPTYSGNGIFGIFDHLKS